jgi:hypothetical protein
VRALWEWHLFIINGLLASVVVIISHLDLSEPRPIHSTKKSVLVDDGSIRGQFVPSGL